MKPPALPRQEWFTVAQAAAYLGMTPKQVYRYTKNGELPCKKFGHLTRVPKRTLDALTTNSTGG